MTAVTTLLLVLAPLISLVGGIILIFCGVRYLLGYRKLIWDLEIANNNAALATCMLGVSFAGLGLTYILTSGSVGHDLLYFLWLAMVLLAGILTFCIPGNSHQ